MTIKFRLVSSVLKGFKCAYSCLNNLKNWVLSTSEIPSVWRTCWYE